MLATREWFGSLLSKYLFLNYSHIIVPFHWNLFVHENRYVMAELQLGIISSKLTPQMDILIHS
jgi:hypothetical protein